MLAGWLLRTLRNDPGLERNLRHYCRSKIDSVFVVVDRSLVKNVIFTIHNVFLAKDTVRQLSMRFPGTEAGCVLQLHSSSVQGHERKESGIVLDWQHKNHYLRPVFISTFLLRDCL